MSSRSKGEEERRSIGQSKNLKTTWTRVGSLRMHARVSGDPAPANDRDAAIVLVHGLVVSSR